MENSLNEAVKVLTLNDIKAEAEAHEIAETPRLTDIQQRGSYSWLHNTLPDEPTMVVPGTPRCLKIWHGGQLLKTGQNLLIDENRYRVPNHPMEPLLRAVEKCAEWSLVDEANYNTGDSIRFQTFDFITDSYVLAQLFGFCSEKEELMNFKNNAEIRIDFFRCGKTVFLQRYDRVLVTPPREQQCEYAKDFDQKITKSPEIDYLKGDFWQMLSYRFGQHNFLVRHKVDCVRQNGLENIHNVEFEDVQLFPSTENLHYIKAGQLCKEWTTVELTTCAYNRQFPNHMWPRLYFSDIQQLIVAWQNWGRLTRPPELLNREQMLGKFQQEYGRPDHTLRRLEFLLREVKKFATQQKEFSCTLLIEKTAQDLIKIVPCMCEYSSLPPEYMSSIEIN